MKKRSIIIGLAVLVLILAYSQRADIAMRIMPGALATAMSSDALKDLGEGLHVTLCGAGGPLPDLKRSGACVAVIAGEKIFVVDAGTNGMRNLGRMRYPGGKIAAVFLTHFHSDHIDGLGEMAMMRWVGSAHTTPLTVYGPEGVADVVAGFNTAYAQDAVYRHAHHGDSVAPLSGRGMTAMSVPLPGDGESVLIFDKDGVTVEMFAVEHFPAEPAVGYLFSYQGRTALISGDTKKSANVEKFAQGIDLLVHEALAPNLVNIMNGAARETGNSIMAKITADILDYHASPVEAAEIARDAGVGHLLYYHIVPILIMPGMETAWLDGVDAVFSDYTVGIDGSSFSLPPNSDEIIQRGSAL